MVGEIESRSESNPDGFAKIYKIYPNLVKINKPPILNDEDLVINPENATVDAKEGKVLVDVVSASTDITWKTVFDGNITAVNPSTGLGPTTGVSISYAENKDQLGKTGKVEFYYFEPGQDATFKLVQKKADDSGGGGDSPTGRTYAEIAGISIPINVPYQGSIKDASIRSNTNWTAELPKNGNFTFKNYEYSITSGGDYSPLEVYHIGNSRSDKNTLTLTYNDGNGGTKITEYLVKIIGS